MATTANLRVVIGAKVDDFTRAMNTVRKEMTAVDRQYRGMTHLGQNLTKTVTVPLLAVGGAAFMAANDIDKAQKIIRAGTGATGAAWRALNEDFKAVFRTVPEGAEVVAAAIADINTRLGLTGPELQRITRLSLDYARVNNEDVADSTRTLGRLVNALGVEYQDIPLLLDMITKASQDTGISANQLAKYVTEAGPAFDEMGFGLERSIALFAQFEAAGARPEELIGSLNIVLTRMAKNGAKNAEEAFRMLLHQIKTAPDLLTAVGIASEAFGSRVGAKVAEDIRAGRFEIDEYAASLLGAQGVLEGAAKDARTFGDEMRALRNASTVALAPLGKAFLELFEAAQPTILELVAGVERLSNRFAELSPEARRNIILTAAWVAAIGPALILIPQLIKLLVLLKLAIKGVGKAMLWLKANPIALAIVGIAALIAAGIWLVRNWDRVKEGGIRAWGELKLYVLRQIDAMLEGMERLASWVPGLGDKISGARAGLAGTIAAEQGLVSTRRAGDYDDALTRYVKNQEAAAAATETTHAAVAGLGGALNNMGNAANGASDNTAWWAKDAKKAAEDTRAAWERTADILGTRLQILKVEHEIAAMAAAEQSNAVEKLALQSQHLSQQLETQRRIVEAVNEGYLASVQAKGETAEETEKLRLKLVQEQKAQADLERQIRVTSNAIQDQGRQLRALVADVERAAEKYRNDLMAAQEEYFRKVTEVNERLAEGERRLTQQYEQQVAQRARTLMDFVGLFDQVATRDVSGDQLLRNLKGQVDAFDSWQQNIAELAARGVDDGLIAELRDMGPKAGPEIAALLTLTDSQLTEYVSLWRQKAEMAKNEARAQLESQRLETIRQIQELRSQAAEELERYRQEWQKKNEEIRKNAMEEIGRIEERYKAITESSTVYGQRLIENFVGGMESRFDMLRNALENMAGIVDSYLPHSPAKVGPLRRLNEYGPALVRGVSAGIVRSLPGLAGTSQGMASAMVPQGGGGSTHSTTNHTPITIHVYGGWDDIERELARRGVHIA